MVLAFVIGACSSGTSDGAPSGTPSEEAGTAEQCCPLSAAPTSCNGVAMGGSRSDFPGCNNRVYDNVGPVTRTVDKNGCPTYGLGKPGAPREPVAYANDCPAHPARDSGPPDRPSGD